MNMDKLINFFHDPIVLLILSALLGGIIATIIYFIFWKARDKRIARKAFKTLWVSSKKLKYTDLSGRKEYTEKNPSTQSHLPKLIQELLDNSMNVLLISNDPMAGKTYFTVNYLRKLENAYVLIPNNDKFDELFEFIPKAPSNANYKIVLLDDIHTYINTGVTRLASFIEKATNEGYIIWGNTIAGSDFDVVKNNIPIKILSTFHDLLISNTLSEEEALKIARSEGLNNLPSHFMGNIGEIFCDIYQVKDRYYKLDEFGKLLLLVIKQLYLVGIYRSPSLILKSDLRRLFEKYEPSISTEALIKKLDELKKSGFLLDSKDPMSISFEEKYLRKVVQTDLKVKDFMKSISEIFPKNVTTYTQAMQSASNYLEAEKIYQDMRSENIQPSVRPFVVLMGKANDSDIGLSWLKEMDKLNISMNDYVINILLRTTQGNIEKKERVIAELELRNIEVSEKINNLIKAPKIQLDLYSYSNLMNLSGSYENALEIFYEMKRNNINPDSITYNILIKLSNDLNKGMKLLDEMIASNISPDNFTYGILINLSRNYNVGKKLFDKMINEGVVPNDAIYGILIKLSNDFIIGKKLLHEMKEKRIPISASRFGFVINLAPNFTQGKELFDVMINEGIAPTCKEYGTLINYSGDYNIGKQLFDEMKSKGIVPTAVEYTTLINISPNFTEGKKLFDEMKSKGIIPNVLTYGTLINLSLDFKKATELLAEMKKDEILPNVEIYGTLINHSGDYKMGKQLFDEMKSKGIAPTAITYGTLINLSNDFKKATELLAEMKKDEVLPNIEIYGTLINLSPNYEIGKELFDEMLEKGILPNSEIYGTLINRTSDFQVGKQLFDEMKRKGIEPSVSTYGTLINVSHDYKIGKVLFDEMVRKGIEPNVSTYGTLINVSRDYKIGKQLFDEMIGRKIEPNAEIYGTLINLSGDYQIVKQLFDEMIIKGIVPNVEIYTMLIRTSKNIEIGRMYLQEMFTKGIKPNNWTFNAIIWLYKYKYQEALAVMQIEMPKQNLKPDVITYTQLMNISKNFDIAIGLFEEMCKVNISPNQHTYRVLEALAGKDNNKLSRLINLWNNCQQRK